MSEWELVQVLEPIKCNLKINYQMQYKNIEDNMHRWGMQKLHRSNEPKEDQSM